MARRDARPDRRPEMEPLEGRTMLASDLAASLLTASPLTATVGRPTPSAAADLTSSGTTNYNDLIRATAARAQFGVDGTGYTVAVIDTGVDYNHEALGGGLGPGHKVIDGYNFGDNNPDPMATWDHGTAVAGLIASGDPNDPGVAPGADIAALKVYASNNQGSYQNFAEALQWVIDHHTQDNITVVNISSSDGGSYTQNWFDQGTGIGPQISGLVAQLDALNIPVVTATGNSVVNNQPGVGFTAILNDTISVTATDASDQFATDAQRVDGPKPTDIAAPGVNDKAPTDGTSNFGSVTGTSFATPLVSGSIVLLQQIYKSRFGTLPTVAQVDGWLKQGADPLTDAQIGTTGIGRLDVLRSAELIPGSTTLSNGASATAGFATATAAVPAPVAPAPKAAAAPIAVVTAPTPPAQSVTPPASSSEASAATQPDVVATPPASTSTEATNTATVAPPAAKSASPAPAPTAPPASAPVQAPPAATTPTAPPAAIEAPATPPSTSPVQTQAGSATKADADTTVIANTGWAKLFTAFPGVLTGLMTWSNARAPKPASSRPAVRLDAPAIPTAHVHAVPASLKATPGRRGGGLSRAWDKGFAGGTRGR